MNYREVPIVFNCVDCRLVGIVTIPEKSSPTGVLIVVGGPQYRPGSHRQFTLLARELAQHGYPSCRFDYRGMGDSEGEMRNFETVNEDLKAAIEAFLATAKGVEQVVIWGLCDAASAALYYAHTDPRIKGLILLNPWVHSEAGEGRARIKHYYLARLFQKSFWLKLFSGKIRIATSVSEVSKAVRFLLGKKTNTSGEISASNLGASESYIDRMLTGLKLYSGDVLIIRSENDLVSQEFADLLRTDNPWQSVCQPPQVEQCMVPEANHTFSSRKWRDQASDLTQEWLNKITRPTTGPHSL